MPGVVCARTAGFFSDNRLVDPWLTAQLIIEATELSTSAEIEATVPDPAARVAVLTAKVLLMVALLSVCCGAGATPALRR